MLAHGEGDLTRSAHACTRRAHQGGEPSIFLRHQRQVGHAAWGLRDGPSCRDDPRENQSRALPRTISFVNTWYGRGTGRQCIACEQRIAVLARRLFWAGHCPM